MLRKKKPGWHRNNKIYLWVGSKPLHCQFAASARDNFCHNPRGSMVVNTALAAEREKPQGLYADVYFSLTQSPVGSRWGGRAGSFAVNFSMWLPRSPRALQTSGHIMKTESRGPVGGFNGSSSPYTLVPLARTQSCGHLTKMQRRAGKCSL